MIIVAYPTKAGSPRCWWSSWCCISVGCIGHCYDVMMILMSVYCKEDLENRKIYKLCVYFYPVLVSRFFYCNKLVLIPAKILNVFVSLFPGLFVTCIQVLLFIEVGIDTVVFCRFRITFEYFTNAMTSIDVFLSWWRKFVWVGLQFMSSHV